MAGCLWIIAMCTSKRLIKSKVLMSLKTYYVPKPVLFKHSHARIIFPLFDQKAQLCDTMRKGVQYIE